MGQVTIYLEDSIEKKMQDAAKSKGLSKSKWIASIIQEKVDTQWPSSVAEAAGTWESFPELDELRSSLGANPKREDF